MVYKKIGDKILSLSSLLLAGVLLAGCDDPKNNQSEAEAKEETKAGDANQGTGKKDEVQTKNFSQYFVEAASKILECLMHSQALEHLHEVVPITPFNAAASKTDKEVAKAVQEFYKKVGGERFTNLFPVKVRENLHAFSQEELAKKITADQYKAYVKAINPLVNARIGLYELVGKLKTVTQSGATKNSIETFRKEVHDFRSSFGLDNGNPLFAPSSEFFTLDNVQMPTAAKLARFFTDEEKDKGHKSYKGTDKKFGGPEAIEKKIDLFVNIKNDDTNRNGNQEKVHIRGAQIGVKDDADSRWYVQSNKNEKKASKDLMPYIPSFRGKDLIYDKFEFDSSTKTFTFSASSSLSSSNSSGQGLKNITAGQLLFTLFNGPKKGIDFIRLTEGETKSFVKLDSDYESFQKVYQAASTGGQTFADLLGGHIQNDEALKELFVIPNYDTIEKSIFNSIDKGQIGTTPMNATTTSSTSFSGKGSDIQFISAGSIADKLVGNILHLFDNTISEFNSSLTGDPMDKAVALVNALIDCGTDPVRIKEFNGSSTTFDQKVAAHILLNLFKDKQKSMWKDSEGSASSLLDMVSSYIKQKLNQTVVYTKGGKYCFTSGTQEIANMITNIYSGLSRKYKKSLVTYETIASLTNNPQFDVSKYNEYIDKTSKLLDSIASVDVSSILALKSPTVNYSSFVGDLTLYDADYKELDQIRLDYHSKESGKNSNA